MNTFSGVQEFERELKRTAQIANLAIQEGMLVYVDGRRIRMLYLN
jgi:hypothetical protein